MSNSHSCGNSVINPGEQCDLGTQDGFGATCCSNKCLFRPANTPCGVRNGPCYKKPRCNSSGTCLNTELKTSGAGCLNGKIAGKCTGAKCVPNTTSPKKVTKSKSKKAVKKVTKSKSKKAVKKVTKSKSKKAVKKVTKSKSKKKKVTKSKSKKKKVTKSKTKKK